MTVITTSVQRMTEIVLGGIPKGYEIAFMDGLTSAMGWLYTKKTGESTLKTSSVFTTKKFARYQDANATYSPTPKTGYQLVDLVDYLSFDPTGVSTLYNTGIDARNLPHEESFVIDKYDTGAHPYRWVYIPSVVDATKFKKWAVGHAQGTNVKSLYHYKSPYQAIYLNDLMQNVTPIYYPKHRARNRTNPRQRANRL